MPNPLTSHPTAITGYQSCPACNSPEEHAANHDDDNDAILRLGMKQKGTPLEKLGDSLIKMALRGMMETFLQTDHTGEIKIGWSWFPKIGLKFVVFKIEKAHDPSQEPDRTTILFSGEISREAIRRMMPDANI